MHSFAAHQRERACVSGRRVAGGLALAVLWAVATGAAAPAPAGPAEPGFAIVTDVQADGFHVRSASLFRRGAAGILPVEAVCTRVLKVPETLGGCALALKAGDSRVPASAAGSPEARPHLLFNVLPVAERLVAQALLRLGPATVSCPDRPVENVAELALFLLAPEPLDAAGALAIYKSPRRERLVYLSDKTFKGRRAAFALPPPFERNAGPVPRVNVGRLGLDVRPSPDLRTVDRAALARLCEQR